MYAMSIYIPPLPYLIDEASISCLAKIYVLKHPDKGSDYLLLHLLDRALIRFVSMTDTLEIVWDLSSARMEIYNI